MNKFKKGTTFLFNEVLWTIIEELDDSDSSWRKMRSEFGKEELVTLETLRKDQTHPSFRIVEIK